MKKFPTTKFPIDPVFELHGRLKSRVLYGDTDFIQSMKDLGIKEVEKVFPTIIPDSSPITVADQLPSSFLYTPFRTLELWLDGESLSRAKSIARKELGSIESGDHSRYQIYFSCDPVDLATMSMRGISSCMSWGGRHSVKLIGSILDPHCGMIILTDNTQAEDGLGKKIVARSLVRSVFDLEAITRENSIFLEKPYLSRDLYLTRFGNDGGHAMIHELFVSYLRKRSLLPIKLTLKNSTYISKETSIYLLPEGFHSCRDSGIKYF